MLSKEEFVKHAFTIAAEMAKQTEWAYHVRGVDSRLIRFKGGKNLNGDRLLKMYPQILEAEPTKEYANPIINSATSNQGCIPVPMREIVRRIRAVHV